MRKQTGSGLRLVWIVIGILLSGFSHAQTLSDALAQGELLELSVGVSGEVSELTVAMGEQVQKGQMLLSLDLRVFDAQLQAAEAGLAKLQFELQLAEEEYERQQELYDEGSMSTVELQMQELAVLESKSTRALAIAVLQRAEQNRSFAQIVAPADGEVVALPLVGQRVSIESGLPTLIKLRLK